jgi:ribosomal protein S18 acetylase RimI-like enzyme
MNTGRETITGNLVYREDVLPSDAEAVRDIIVSTGFFTGEEVDISVELVGERLARGIDSGYFFLFAEKDGRVAGYTCYGPVPGTESSFDMYWIAVDNGLRGRGIGRALMEKSELAIKGLGGTRIYIETSSKDKYRPTRSFYESRGYRRDAFMEDFYRPGDSKVVYVKKL